MKEIGRIENVYSATLGSILNSEASIGASTIFVSSALDFDEDGGLVLIDGTPYEYQAIDLDQNTIILGAGVTITQVAESDSEVVVYPVSTTLYADVSVGDEGDSLTVEVPHTLSALLSEGIREQDEREVAELALEGSVWRLENITGVEPTVNTAAIAEAVREAGSDGLAPEASPTPNVVGGIDTFNVRWVAINNDSAVNYDVYMSTAQDFTAGVDSFIGTTQATSLTIKTEADFTQLERNTPYFFKIVARDIDGSAATSISGTDSLRQITNSDIAVEYIYAGNIYADQIIGGEIGADLLLAGSIATATAGARVELSGTGIVIYGTDGIPTTTLGTDSNSVFKGDAEIGSLTVTNALSIRGTNNEVSRSGTLTLASGTTAGSTPPTVVNDYDSILFTKSGDDSFVASNVTSCTRVGTMYVAGYRDSAGYKVYNFNLDGTFNSIASSNITSGTALRSTKITASGLVYTSATNGTLYRHAIETPETYIYSDTFESQIYPTYWDIDVTNPSTGNTNLPYSNIVWDNYFNPRVKMTNRSTSSASYNNELRNKQVFDLQNRYVAAKVSKPTALGSSKQHEFSLSLRFGIDNLGLAESNTTTTGIAYMTIDAASNTLSMSNAYSMGLEGAETFDNSSVTYNATSMVYLRISESNNKLSFETSPDGDTWTVRFNPTHTYPQAVLASTKFRTVYVNAFTSTGTVTMDDFRYSNNRGGVSEPITRNDTTNTPAIGHDGGTNLYLAEYDPTNKRISIRRYSADTLAENAVYVSANNSVPSVSGPLTGVYYGNADFGGPRFVVKPSGASDYIVLSLSGSTLTVLPNEAFAASDSGSKDFTWDGTQFQALGTNGRLYKHSMITWNDIAGGSRTAYAGFTWYDSITDGGTHETTISPLNTFMLKKRARLTVTSPSLPSALGTTDDVNSIRVYIGFASNVLYRQGMTVPGANARNFVANNLNLTGSAPPATNDFPGGVPGRIRNAANDLRISGDGSIKAKAIEATESLIITTSPASVLKATDNSFTVDGTGAMKVRTLQVTESFTAPMAAIPVASRRKVTAQSVAVSTTTVIDLDTINLQEGINWDATNKAYIIVTAGLYNIGANMAYSNGANQTSGRAEVSIYINGVQVSNSQSIFAASQPCGAFCSCVRRLAVGDSVSLRTFQTSGGAAAVRTGAAFTYMDIVRLGD